MLYLKKRKKNNSMLEVYKGTVGKFLKENA